MDGVIEADNATEMKNLSTFYNETFKNIATALKNESIVTTLKDAWDLYDYLKSS